MSWCTAAGRESEVDACIWCALHGMPARDGPGRFSACYRDHPGSPHSSSLPSPPSHRLQATPAASQHLRWTPGHALWSLVPQMAPLVCGTFPRLAASTHCAPAAVRSRVSSLACTASVAAARPPAVQRSAGRLVPRSRLGAALVPPCYLNAMPTCRVVAFFCFTTGGVLCVALSPCTRFAILGCANNTARMYDVISGAPFG